MNTIPISPGSGSVAVIGGGIFGTLAALKLAEAGCRVTIFEAGGELLCGASLANQNRLHLGYHYPRSPETARACAVYERGFRRMFPGCVIDSFDHYYAVARGGKVDFNLFLHFCGGNNLDYEAKMEPPWGIEVNADMMDGFFKVPEGIIDAGLLRAEITRRIAANGNISVNYFSHVNNLHYGQNGWRIEALDFDAVINATYGNINRVIGEAGFEAQEYKYELCEVVVIKNPFKRRIGIGIVDGPFFGVLPFGNSENYLLYDVEHSVLACSMGTDPGFSVIMPGVDAVAEERFQDYVSKAAQYLPEMAHAERLYSMYAVKVTKPDHGHDADDARPTEIISHGNGFYSIFAGKISAAIPAADRITQEVSCYLS